MFYGANAYGIHDTAAIFFNSTPDALSLPQAALLLGQINAPTAYNPLPHRDRATICACTHVLERMRESGHLDGLRRKCD